MKRYAVMIEKTGTGYGAHVPDLPGCIATGKTYEKTLSLIREAIEFHVEGMRLHGEQVQETVHEGRNSRSLCLMADAEWFRMVEKQPCAPPVVELYS